MNLYICTATDCLGGHYHYTCTYPYINVFDHILDDDDCFLNIFLFVITIM